MSRAISAQTITRLRRVEGLRQQTERDEELKDWIKALGEHVHLRHRDLENRRK